MDYDVCLSFAAEQRPYVEEVASLLRDNKVRVFYDLYEVADMLGRDLYVHLDEIYRHRSRYCVLFASVDYERKVWTNHERASAQARAMTGREDYIIPVRFDDTRIPGLRETVGFVDGRRTSPGEVVQLLLTKLKHTPSQQFDIVSTSILAMSTDESSVDTGQLLDCALSHTGVRLTTAQRTVVNGDIVALLPLEMLSTLDVLTELVPAIESEASQLGVDRPNLRIGLHRGAIPGGRNDWACVDVATALDTVRAAAVREVLAKAPRARWVVVVSQRIYEELLVPGLRGLSPATYRRVALSNGTSAWVRVPGYPKPRVSAAGPEPSADVPGGRTPTFHFSGPIGTQSVFTGPTTIGRIGTDITYHQPEQDDDRR